MRSTGRVPGRYRVRGGSWVGRTGREDRLGASDGDGRGFVSFSSSSVMLRNGLSLRDSISVRLDLSLRDRLGGFARGRGVMSGFRRGGRMVTMRFRGGVVTLGRTVRLRSGLRLVVTFVVVVVVVVAASGGRVGRRRERQSRVNEFASGEGFMSTVSFETVGGVLGYDDVRDDECSEGGQSEGGLHNE